MRPRPVERRGPSVIVDGQVGGRGAARPRRADRAGAPPIVVASAVALFSAGGVLGAVALVVADPGRDVGAAWATAGVSLSAAVLIAALHERLPAWWPHLAMVVGVAVVAADVLVDPYARSATEAGAVFMFLWICLFAACFFPPRAAAAHLALVAGVLLVLLVLRPPPTGAAAGWVVVAGSFAVAVAIVRTQRKLLDRLLEREGRAARTDPLTGLPNRRALVERFEAGGAPGAALLLVDLDHFKRVNDRWGHDHGDTVLRDVARLLEAARRPEDLVARLGGEEFVVLLPGGDLGLAQRVGERIRAVVAARFAEHDPPVTTSIGAAAASGTALGALLQAADGALYRAKEGGRNQVALAPAGGPD